MQDSLKKRYLAKLSANLIGLPISIVTQAIIPRGLGPKACGDFHFLSNFLPRLPVFWTWVRPSDFIQSFPSDSRILGLFPSTFHLREIDQSDKINEVNTHR